MDGRHFMLGFNEDPFFRAHNEAVQRMMGGFNDPFFQRHYPMIDDSNHYRRRENNASSQVENNMVVPGDMFPHMNSIFSSMDSMFANMHQNFGALANHENAHSYSSSTVMSYSHNGREEPKYFQATTTTRKAPGGVRETKKSLRDSKSGMHKIAVEQHIGDRGHMYERSRNARTGDTEEKREFFNMLDDDATMFDREWRNRTNCQDKALGYRRTHKHSRQQPNSLKALKDKRVEFDARARKRSDDKY